MKIIVNADDLGRSLEVNNAIFKLMDEKLISSSTIMANGPFVKDAVERSKKYPNCSFGIHLNLTEFEPLSKRENLSFMLDNYGNFKESNFKILRREKLSDKNKEALYNELDAQILRLQHLGLKISHIDSHHHIHTLPKLLSLLKKLQEKYVIGKIRISTNIYPNLTGYNRIIVKTKTYYKKLLNNNLSNKKYKSITTEGFGGLIPYYNNFEYYKNKYFCIELSVHPGHSSYKNEYDIYGTKWYKQLIQDNSLINYNLL